MLLADDKNEILKLEDKIKEYIKVIGQNSDEFKREL